MKVEVIWNRPDGTKPTVGFDGKPDDPFADDEEMQVAKARAGAQAYFQQKFGEAPPMNALTHRVIKD